MMKKIVISKLLSSLLVLIIVLTVILSDPMSFDAEAANKKVTSSVCNHKKASKYNKAPSIRVGTTKVLLKKKNALVKFKATENKTYTFTVSNLYDPKDSDNYVCGHFYVMRRISENSQYISGTECKTQGGKATSFNIAGKSFLDGWKQKKVLKKNRYRLSRYAKVSLEAGETVYIEVHVAGIKSQRAGYTIKVK